MSRRCSVRPYMDMSYTLNIRGRLLPLDEPVVMGILNVTDDSFFDGSRVASSADLVCRAKSMLEAGASILDVGACSTRPEVELARLHAALEVLDKELPDAVVSIDTYRAAVVRECVASHNVSIINDVSCMEWDDKMLDTVAACRLPYVLTHSEGLAGEVV